MIRRGDAAETLLMFPRLSTMGLEVWFRSIWYGHELLLMEADGLVPTVVGDFFPYCRWCRVFQSPHDGPGSHRQSKQHTEFREYYLKPAMKDYTGNSLNKLREDISRWSHDDMCL